MKTLLCLTLLLASVAPGGAAPDRTGERDQPSRASSVRRLEPGVTVEMRVSRGETQTYRFRISAGEYTRLRLLPRATGLSFRLLGPDGRPVVESGIGAEPERLAEFSVIAARGGKHQLEIRSAWKTSPIGYTLRMEAPRPAVAVDRTRLLAEQAFFGAELALAAGTADQIVGAAAGYESAADLFAKAHDPRAQAACLARLGLTRLLRGASKDTIEIVERATPLCQDDGACRAGLIEQKGRARAQLGESKEALDLFAAALELRRSLEDRGGEAILLDRIGQTHRALDEPARALEVLERSLALTKEVEDTAGQAAVLDDLGDLAQDQGKPQKAFDRYTEALALQREAGDRRGEAASLSGLGSLLGGRGEVAAALERLDQALELQRTTGDRLGEAATLNRLGIVSVSADDPGRAVEAHQQALSIHRELENRVEEAATLIQLGDARRALGLEREAIDDYDRSREIYQSLGDQRRLAVSLGRLGRIHAERGDRQRAIRCLLRALPLHRAAGDATGEASTLDRLGAIYMESGEPEESSRYYQRALELWHAAGDAGAEARALGAIGKAAGALGRYEEALDACERSLPLRRAAADAQGEAETLDEMGRAFAHLGEMDKALAHHQSALGKRRETGDRRGRIVTLQDLGRVYHALGRDAESLDALNEALSLAREIGERSQEASTLHALATIEKDAGRLERAQSEADQAIAIIESLDIDPSRSFTEISVRAYYVLDIELLMRMHAAQPDGGYDAKAFDRSERMRARLLVESLAQAHADLRNADAALLDRQRQLRRRLEQAASRALPVPGARPQQQTDGIPRQPDALREELRQVDARIDEANPRYARLLHPAAPTIADLQRDVLDEQTMLLEFTLGEKRSYLWTVTTSGFRSYTLPGRPEIEAAVRRFFDLLTARSRQVRFEMPEARNSRIRIADRDYPKAAEALARALLAPGLPGDGGSSAASSRTRRLLIVADGALQYVPFAALPDPAAAPSAGKPLVTSYEIVSLPSASMLRSLREELHGRAPAKKTLAVLADPVFDRSDDQLGAGAEGGDTVDVDLERASRDIDMSEGELRVRRPRFTRQEASEILSLVPAGERMQALGLAASRATVTSGALKEYRFVHFATHAFLDAVHPDLSGIVLSLVDEEGHEQDGFLRAHELYGLELPADLVVVSGCRTGLGREVRGEGLVGLTRGIMYAGAARVVVSLWDLQDRAAAEFMAGFYRLMLGPSAMRPAAALREAQLAAWKRQPGRPPYDWAAFVLQGEPR